MNSPRARLHFDVNNVPCYYTNINFEETAVVICGSATPLLVALIMLTGRLSCDMVQEDEELPEDLSDNG